MTKMFSLEQSVALDQQNNSYQYSPCQSQPEAHNLKKSYFCAARRYKKRMPGICCILVYFMLKNSHLIPTISRTQRVNIIFPNDCR